MWIVWDPLVHEGCRIQYTFCSQTCLLGHFESKLVEKIKKNQKETSELLKWMGY